MINFKKGGLFSHCEEEEEDLPGAGEDGGVLAVWGSPGAGKTTAAVKIAKYLADQNKNVIALFCDMTAPMIPCICPPSSLEYERSLGSILAASHVSENLVKQNCILLKKQKYLSLIGLLRGENEYTYPPYSVTQASELLERLRSIAAYVIIDCSSYIANDILSAVSLMEADSVLRLVNCDLKSISYLSSQLPLLKDHKWDAQKQIKVASNVKSQEATHHVEQVLGGVSYRMPHSFEIQSQALEGNLFKDLTMKESKGFKRELEKIMKEVFPC